MMENALIAGGSGFSGVELVVQDSIEELLSFFVRKGAHMFLFFVLAILVWFALTKLIDHRPRRAAVVAVICTLLAALDEFHQKLVPGRSGELRDVLVDTAGILIALLLFTMPSLGEWLRRNLSHPGILWIGGTLCGTMLLIWVGTMDELPFFFLHRTTQVDHFASMDSGERRVILASSVPILRQALYLAACGVMGFVDTFLACLVGVRNQVPVALTLSLLLCCGAGLLWTGLPVVPGVLLALAAGLVAVGLKQCFPLLKI